MYLPEELVVEILSRVPLTSVARLRWASKGWNAMIKDKILAMKQSQIIMLIDSRVYLVSVDMHKIDNNKVNLTSQFSLKDPLSHNFSEEVDIQNVFHCDGLFLCTTKDDRLVVWNLLSRETRWIQPEKSYTTIDIFALGYNNKSSCYTILRMFRLHNEFQSMYKYEVYDFTSNSWRVSGVTTGWFIPLSQIRRGMFVKGNTYWLAEDLEHPEIEHSFLLSFDFSSETFQCSSLPADANTLYMALSVSREQQLCMLATDRIEGLDTHVWMATKIESTGALSWTKFLTVTRSGVCYPYYLRMISFLIDQENKVVYCKSLFTNTIHIVGENKYIEFNDGVAEPPNEFHTLFLLSYVPSFVKIQQGI